MEKHVQLPDHNVIRRARADDNFLDTRCLDNITKIEARYLTNSRLTWNRVQTDIQPWMRKKVVEWMLEVSSEMNLEKSVFQVAVTMLDRTLSKMHLNRQLLQLLGSASILLASKLKETYPVRANSMVIYTDNSITHESLVIMEETVLTQLMWDISCPTAIELVDLFMIRNELKFKSDKSILNHIKYRSRKLSQLVTCEHQACSLRPSILAVASIIISTYETFKSVCNNCKNEVCSGWIPTIIVERKFEKGLINLRNLPKTPSPFGFDDSSFESENSDSINSDDSVYQEISSFSTAIHSKQAAKFSYDIVEDLKSAGSVAGLKETIDILETIIGENFYVPRHVIGDESLSGINTSMFDKSGKSIDTSKENLENVSPVSPIFAGTMAC